MLVYIIECYNKLSIFLKVVIINMKKILKITAAFMIVIVLFITTEIIISYKCLTISHYKIKSDKIKNNTRIILLSDLHNNEFGKENQRLVSKIKAQKPDLILLDGDILNEEGKDEKIATYLVKRLKKIAPVYYSLGNHELGYMKAGRSDLLNQLKAAGAQVLDKNYKDININQNKIRIGGLYEYAFAVDDKGNMSKEKMKPVVRKFLTQFEDTDHFKIMMSHRPDSFIFGHATDTWKIDLVASGHAHGGQVRFPFKGGLYGADQGWFPKYVDGIHHFDKVKNLIITRGLGSDKEKLPRFHNIPEIVVIDLTSK